MPYKTWVVGEEVLAADFNTFVQQQTVASMPNAAGRDTDITAPQEGQLCYLRDVNRLQVYDGTVWTTAGATVVAYVEVTANQVGIATTITDLTGLTTAALTIPAGRRLQVAAEVTFNKAAPDVTQWIQLQIADAANAVAATRFDTCIAPGLVSVHTERTISPAAGSYTYKGRANTGAGFANVQADASMPAWIRVTDLGPT